MAKTRALIVDLEPRLYQWLVVRAALHDRSTEAEAMAILAAAKAADESAPADDAAGVSISP